MQACTAKMSLSEEVDLEDYVSRPDKISAADIAAICQVRIVAACPSFRFFLPLMDTESTAERVCAWRNMTSIHRHGQD